MTSIESLLDALSEDSMAQAVGIPHDEARISFHRGVNTVGSFDEFSDVIGDYYQHHYATCVAVGGVLSAAEARSRAKEILEREYRRHSGNIVTAYNDAHHGWNGGLRSILDIIADALKAECAERYTREAFDRHVAPNSWEQKVEIIRQFFAKCPFILPLDIRVDRPEQYADNYQELIRAFVSALQRTWAAFRRA